MLSEFKLYLRYIRIHLLSGLEYKGWPLMVLQMLIFTALDPLAVILIFSRFGNIGTWTMERILLVYSITFTSFGLAESFCRGFDRFPWYMVRGGNFDRLLLRPKSLFTQVAASYFHMHRVARPLAGLVIIGWTLGRLDIAISPQNIVILAFALIGGFLMYTGVIVMNSGISFFTIGGLDFMYIFTSASRDIARIPVEHIPQIMRKVFTFFVPMLVISYFPASAVGGWDGAAWRGWLALPAGALFLSFALVIWKIGVRHYKSVGS